MISVFATHNLARRVVRPLMSSVGVPAFSAPPADAQQSRRQLSQYKNLNGNIIRCASSVSVTNGGFLKHSMLYHDSVAFLLSNQLGLPSQFVGGGKTPTQVAKALNLSVRGASALLVTLCRMEVVQVLHDSDESVDDVVYELTPSAQEYLSDRNSAACFSPFVDTMTNNFTTPESLLECSRPQEKKDLMTEHLEENDEDIANNARHFIKHMNAQSYCCAKALPDAICIRHADKPTTLLDVGGGSAIYTIEAAKSNPNVKGVVFELPAIKPITEAYIEEANLSDRIKVAPGDFFTDPFPGPVDLVLFSNILHDWPDETNIQLIDKAYESLAPGGRIVISELLLSDDIKSSTVSSSSMNIIMLPYTKGRQYRPKELFRRLERAGFVQPRVTKLVDDYDLVIATKPE